MNKFGEESGVIGLHAYSSLYAEVHGTPKPQLVHELSMLLLARQIDGSETPEKVYGKYKELRALFVVAIED